MTIKFPLTAIFAGAALVAASAVTALAATDQGRQANGITQSYAKAQITGDGYTNVSDLQQKNGGWSAQAEQQGKPVSLWVNKMGDVQSTNASSTSQPPNKG